MPVQAEGSKGFAAAGYPNVRFSRSFEAGFRHRLITRRAWGWSEVSDSQVGCLDNHASRD